MTACLRRTTANSKPKNQKSHPRKDKRQKIQNPFVIAVLTVFTLLSKENLITMENATPAENSEAQRRIFNDAFNRLTISGQTFALGCTTVFGLSCFEGYIHLEPRSVSLNSQKLRFVLRYGLANVIPSAIWGRIEAKTIVDALGLSRKILQEQLPPRLVWRRTRLQSYRGAIAGTLIISQLFSFSQVVNQAKDSYSQRLCNGREPPLVDPSQQQVVVRLAGRVSDVTTLGMLRDGRRKYFPIFEDSRLIQVQHLVQNHSAGKYGVPIFWQVGDGQYGLEDSWRGMQIPSHWLFHKKKHSNNPEHDKILILEADATDGDSLSLRLPHHKGAVLDMDLDLYEVAQGYYRLRRLVAKGAPRHDILQVLLVNSDAVLENGGGCTLHLRQYAKKLGLADVIIDARAPLLFSIKRWLEQRSWNHKSILKPGVFSREEARKKPVILETPSSTCFESIKAALGDLDYEVITMTDAMDRYGPEFNVPILVYERTTQNTIHTVGRLVNEQDNVRESNVCALCPTHHGLVELKSDESSPIATICSSDIHDNLFRLVRRLAIEGYSPKAIQEKIDNQLDNLLDSNDGAERRCLGFPQLYLNLF